MAVILTNRILIIGIIVIGIGGVVAYTTIPSLVNDSDNVKRSDFVEFINVQHTNIATSSAVIVATTSIPVFCEIEYAEFEKDTLFASDSDVNTEPHTEHNIPISGLKPTTHYNYRFQVDYDGKIFYSNIRAFITLD